MHDKSEERFTARWLDDGKIIYQNEPHGNLFGRLPLGSMPSRFPGRLASDEGGWDEWDGAEFICEGRTIRVTKDYRLCQHCGYCYPGDACDNPGCEASGNVTPEVLARREREDRERADRERTARIRSRLLSGACAGFLLFAGLASAAPIAPVEICRKQPNGIWAKRTPGGKLSTIACELAVTIRLTDRTTAITVKRATLTTCLVWVPESTDTSHGLGPAAWDACIDAMHGAAEKEVAP